MSQANYDSNQYLLEKVGEYNTKYSTWLVPSEIDLKRFEHKVTNLIHYVGLLEKADKVNNQQEIEKRMTQLFNLREELLLMGKIILLKGNSNPCFSYPWREYNV